ncbi:ATP-binding cassette domain-containing protein [Thermodesulfobacteriota bacterium B35]
MVAEDQAGAVLTLTDVTKTFRVGSRVVTALDGISLSVRPAMVTGLIGPDGAGKTTLMRLLAGLLRPDTGRVEVLGLDAGTDYLAVQATLGYMPQRFGLYEELSVQENLDLYADLQGVPVRARPGRYEELMQMTGLAPFTGRLAGRLSGGMKQKLGLACTLIKPPRLLVLDEPTVGVDPVSRRELWEIVYRQVESEGMSVLLSTAYLDEAERCQEVVLMHEGSLLGQDRPQVFSKQLAGHCFLVHSDRENRRRLQERLSRSKGAIDAIIVGSRVRLVTAEAMEEERVAELFSTPESRLEVSSVPPRFEDTFIYLLRRRLRESGRDSGPRIIRPTRVDSAGEQEVIVVRNLERRFGSFYAVKNLSFTVERGEIFGLLGANGAGKSTTFRMLCGLLPASGGTLRVAGRDLHTARARARARIGYMAQKFSLYGGMTVLQNLQFFSSAYSLSGARQRQRIDWVLESFELGPLRNVVSENLPLGFKQRLALAAALMHEPEILFLDEPTSGVDPLARREFWRHINALAEAGVTVLVTTHFMEEAEYCDRLVIMARGEVLASGDPEQLKREAAGSGLAEPTMEDAFIALISHAKPPGRPPATR